MELGLGIVLLEFSLLAVVTTANGFGMFSFMLSIN